MTDLEDRLPAALRRLAENAGHADHLADDVRRAGRRRRLMTVGPLAAVLAVCAVVGLVWVTAARSAPSPVTGGGDTATTGCQPLSTGPLPAWARAGFTGDGAGVHWTLSASGKVAAIVFAYPLVAPTSPDGRNNKILWVVDESSRTVSTTDGVPDGSGSPNENDAIIGHLQGTGVTATVKIIAAGPSIVDMPQPGCWHLDLPTRWANQSDSINLEWVAASGG